MIRLRVENAAENLAALFGGGVNKAEKLALGNHGYLRKLVGIKPDEFDYSAVYVFYAGYGLFIVRQNECGIGFFFDEAFAFFCGTQIFGIAADSVFFVIIGKNHFHVCRCCAVGVFAA